MFQAGVDEIVITPAQNEVCGKARDCRLESFAHAKHELLMETDAVRSQVIGDALNFFDAH
jgi:alpha-beta hydrolase superfamily lysophospholipase